MRSSPLFFSHRFLKLVHESAKGVGMSPGQALLDASVIKLFPSAYVALMLHVTGTHGRNLMQSVIYLHK
jgi:hypothetical protein